METDGERYHLTPSARDRDRLRQNHLEKNLGWRFHRVWSTDWFRDQAGETARIVASWRAAVMAADREPDSVNEHVPPPVLSEPHEVDRGPRPHIARRDDITEYPQAELVACFRWLLRDQRLLDRNTRLVQAKDELEFQRLGPRMRTILGAALDIAQQQAKKEGN